VGPDSDLARTDATDVVAIGFDDGAADVVAEVVRTKEVRHGWTAALAWCLILAATTFVAGTVAYQQFVARVEANEAAVVGNDERPFLLLTNFQIKMTVGMHELSIEDASSPNAMIESGSIDERYCRTILIGELQGYGHALNALSQIERLAARHNRVLTERQQRLGELLRRLFSRYRMGRFDGPGLDAADQSFLIEQLGWSGRLALAPQGSPQQQQRAELLEEARGLAITVIVFGVTVILMCVAGLAALVVFFILILLGTVRSGIPRQSFHGAVYAETFALWLIVFVILQLGLGALGEVGHLPGMMTLSMILPLAVLVWPIVRGVTPRQVCYDIGWRWKNPIVEASCGFMAYLATLPAIAVGFLLFLVLTVVAESSVEHDAFAPIDGAPHPIHEEVAEVGRTLPLLEIIVLACLVAPLVEETMFRGVLYRHLRDATWRWPPLVSIALAAGLNSFLFAAIHPQGLMAVPLLTALALGFSMARQWRGSLMAPMMMHAMHNGMVTSLLVLML
jgi:membrane protease YdiL (CAAX protease family)